MVDRGCGYRRCGAIPRLRQAGGQVVQAAILLAGGVAGGAGGAVRVVVVIEMLFALLLLLVVVGWAWVMNRLAGRYAYIAKYEEWLFLTLLWVLLLLALLFRNAIGG